MNFADGTKFSATAPQTSPLLTISVPIGLQFGAKPERILVQGNGQGQRKKNKNPSPRPIDTTIGLHVGSNQTLALVGGDVALSGGTLKTAGGRIELGSVAGPGLVSLTPIDLGLALDYEGVPTFGDIHLSGRASVDASGTGGGDIQVRGSQVTLQDGSQIEASTLGSQPGGILHVTALESVELIGRSADNNFSSGLFTLVYSGATGKGGDINITTGSLAVINGGILDASTRGKGNAGSVNIHARSKVSFDGVGSKKSPSAAFTQVRSTRATGKGGDINIRVRSPLMGRVAKAPVRHLARWHREPRERVATSTSRRLARLL